MLPVPSAHLLMAIWGAVWPHDSLWKQCGCSFQPFLCRQTHPSRKSHLLQSVFTAVPFLMWVIQMPVVALFSSPSLCDPVFSKDRTCPLFQFSLKVPLPGSTSENAPDGRSCEETAGEACVALSSATTNHPKQCNTT